MLTSNTTPSGKINRLALPAPEIPDAGLALPRAPAEAKLAEIWQEILGVEHIGIRDDFFTLGGHSLLATQVISRVRDEFGPDLKLLHDVHHRLTPIEAARLGRSLEPYRLTWMCELMAMQVKCIIRFLSLTKKSSCWLRCQVRGTTLQWR